MEGCSKTSAGAASGLPEGPLVEILSRLPAKSVCRFKCVSKGWCDLINDPAIRKKLRQPMQGLIIQTSEASDSEVGNGRISFSFSFADFTVRSVPLDIHTCFSFLTEMTGIWAAFLLQSCNGLTLFRVHQGSSVCYIVCNPTTRQWSAVPFSGSCEGRIHTYLAFDPAVSSHFHLFQFLMPHMVFQMPYLHEDVVLLHVYSSETGTWSQNLIDERGQLEGWHHRFTLDASLYRCAFVNSFLHLIVWGSDGKHILAVDVQGKARRMITMPGMADGSQRRSDTCYLGQSQGQLHCVTIDSVAENNDKLCTWVLQDYDAQEWVLKSTVNSLDVFGETGVRLEYQVVDIHQDCNVLFFFHRLTCELIAYNMDCKAVSVIATFKDKKLRSAFARYIPYFSESPVLTNKY